MSALDSQASPRLLVVDDDPRLRLLLRGEFECEGFDVTEASDGIEALTKVRQGSFDLILLDWQLPDLSGLELCRRLRDTGVATSLLMLTGRDEVRDRVEALDAGANDYVIKPFSIEELMARVRVQLRAASQAAAGAAAAASSDLLQHGNLTVNTATREVHRAGLSVSLSVREYELLLCLLHKAERVVERRQLLQEVWGDDQNIDPNCLDVYVGYLRRKLESPQWPKLIHTVRGVGFMLREEAAAS